jgi:predicted RNase H-like HicB family nuclease
MRSYVTRILIEEAGGQWAAYSPDAQGCIAFGPDEESAIRNMRSALKEHFGGIAWQRAAPNDHLDRRFRRFSLPPEEGFVVRAIIFWPMDILKSDAFSLQEPPTGDQILDW